MQFIKKKQYCEIVLKYNVIYSCVAKVSGFFDEWKDQKNLFGTL